MEVIGFDAEGADFHCVQMLSPCEAAPNYGCAQGVTQQEQALLNAKGA